MNKLPEVILPITVFYSYAHEDENLRNELEKHLSNLMRQGFINSWHDRRIAAGTERLSAIHDQLDNASVILLLISPDFLASDYCYSIEMQHALERHKTKESIVIPIILRPVDWDRTPFSNLQALPPDERPITVWEDRDEAFLAITKEFV